MTHLPSAPQASLIDIFRRYPEIAVGLHEFAETVMRGDSPFSPAERELMAGYVSALNGCDYCRGSHGATAENFGIGSGLISALEEDIRSAPVRDELKPVFRYLEKLTREPASIGKEDVDAILAAGWSEDAVVSATLVCGQFSLMNRLVEGLGIEAEPEVMKMAGEMLYRHGYKGIVQAIPK